MAIINITRSKVFIPKSLRNMENPEKERIRVFMRAMTSAEKIDTVYATANTNIVFEMVVEKIENLFLQDENNKKINITTAKEVLKEPGLEQLVDEVVADAILWNRQVEIERKNL